MICVGISLVGEMIKEREFLGYVFLYNKEADLGYMTAPKDNAK